MKALQRIVSVTLVVAVLLMSSGCAGMRAKFKSSKSVDLMPFAENTVAMLTTPENPLSQDNSVLIRDFVTSETPGMARLNELLAEADVITESMMVYSIELMQISEKDISEEERCRALVGVVKTMEGPIRKKLEISDAEFQALLDAIGDNDNFLAAIREIQPLIESASLYFNSLLNEASEQATLMAKVVDQRIDARFKPLLDFATLLEARKGSAFTALALLHKARMGEPGALEALRKGKYILDPALMLPAKATEADLAKVEAYVMDRLQLFQKTNESVQPEVELYRDTHRELDEQYTFVLDSISMARLKFVVWAQAHEKMASGKKIAAEWFDIADAPKLLIKAGVKALK